MGWSFEFNPVKGCYVAERNESSEEEPSIALNVLDAIYYHYGEKIREYRVSTMERLGKTKVVAAVLKGEGPELVFGVEFAVDRDEMAEDPEVIWVITKNLIERLSAREPNLLIQTGAAMRRQAVSGALLD